MAAGALLLLIGTLILAPRLLEADRWRPRAVAYLEASTGKKVTMGRLQLSFFPTVTIRIDDLAIESPPLFPPSDILRVARIEARIDPWALLRRQVAIQSLTLQQPLINLVSDPDGPWNFENPKVGERSSAIRIGMIRHVRIDRAHVLIANLLPTDAAGPVFFEARGLSTELEDVNPAAIVDPRSTSLDGQGTLEAATLRLGSIEATDLTSSIRLEARRVEFAGVHAKTYGGSLNGFFSMKFSGRRTTFTSAATMQHIDMARLLDAFDNARGKMTGTMEGRLEIAGQIAHNPRPFEGLDGSGHLTVHDGQVPSLRLNANLMSLAHYNDLGPAKNDPSSFNLISADFALSHEQIFSKLIDIDGYGVDIDGSGTISVSGSDQIDYRGIAAITSKQGVVTNLFARLAGGTLKDGKLSFPFHLGGTIESPVFSHGN